MSPPTTDEALADRLAAGDEAALLQLVTTHQRAMLAVASTFTGNRALAEEIVQETWMAVVTGIDRFERRSSLKTWIFRILANRARTRPSREARTLPFSAFDVAEESGPVIPTERFDGRGMWAEPPKRWAETSAEGLLERAEVRRQIDNAIDALPPRQRAILVLRDVEGVDADEAAEVLGISEVNQRVLLHRARTAVRLALEPILGGA
jgi:RNA polymerase sigma-70 factor (ECF subfamily)